MWLVYVVGIVFGIWLIYVIFFSYKLKLQTINCYTGGLGSGKTLQATKTALKLRNRSLLAHYLFHWNLGKFAKFSDKFNVRCIYSNYPILIKKEGNTAVFSEPLKREHILGVERVKENSIIVLDEAQIMFPNQRNRSDPEVIWNLTFARHFHNSTIIMCTQSIGNIDVAIRRVVNVIYNFSSFRKLIPIIGLYKVDVNKINYMEDVVVNVNDINTDNDLRVYGVFGKRRYNSRYMKDYYKPDDSIESNYKYTDFKLNPMDNFVSVEKYKEAFYNGK